jgi:hypothetical protein
VHVDGAALIDIWLWRLPTSPLDEVRDDGAMTLLPGTFPHSEALEPPLGFRDYITFFFGGRRLARVEMMTALSIE